MRHLLAIDDLERPEIEAILDRAESFAEVGRRDIKKVPTLRGRTVVTLFYESSTRTSSSFELAAKRLSADLVSVKAAGSSVEKGESLKDTIATLSAYGPEAIVIRSPDAGAADLVATWTEAAVVNAGDGKHEHPSQALLDVYTMQRVFSFESKKDSSRRTRFDELRRKYKDLTRGLDHKVYCFCGDIGRGRTVRSLAELLAGYEGVTLIFVSPNVATLRLSDDLRQRLAARGVRMFEVDSLDEPIGGTPVIELIRTTYDTDNRPVEVMVSVIAGDMATFCYDFPIPD